jgi:hypothetical protein
MISASLTQRCGSRQCGDVVCLMPTKDSPNQITAQVAMVVMFELVSLIAARKNKGVR